MSGPSRAGQERRSAPRWIRAECRRITTARLRPGRDVEVIDLSSGGALLEARCRLLPGARVELQLELDERWYVTRGRVLRSRVARLDRLLGVAYRAAVAFDAAFPIPFANAAASEADGNALPVQQEGELAAKGSCYP